MTLKEIGFKTRLQENRRENLFDKIIILCTQYICYKSKEELPNYERSALCSSYLYEASTKVKNVSSGMILEQKEEEA